MFWCTEGVVIKTFLNMDMKSRLFVALGGFFLLIVLLNLLGKQTRSTEAKQTAEKHSAALERVSKLPPHEIMKQLRQSGEEITTESQQLASISLYLEAAKRVRGSYKPSEQQAIDRIQTHVEWGQWLSAADYDIPATAKCQAVVQQRMKAPDSVEWKGHQGKYDPYEDYVLYVILQADAMNSFGATLRGTFECSLKCDTSIHGITNACVVTQVDEG